MTSISTSRPVGSTPWKGAPVGAREDLARHDLVALGDLVEDRRAEVGKGGAEPVELLADAARAGRDDGRAGVVEHVRVQQLAACALVGSGLVLVDEPANDVLRLHERSPSWSV
jgi:hypothetical protein